MKTSLLNIYEITSKDEIGKPLNAIMIDKDIIIATNGYSLIEVKTYSKIADDKVFIHRYSANSYLKIAKIRKETETNIEDIEKITTGDYPDYKIIMPKNEPKKVIFLSIKNLIKLLTTIKKLDVKDKIALSINTNKLVITAQGEGEPSEDITSLLMETK